MNNASGSLLAQYTATDALANEVLAASADLRLEVTRIVICNTSGSAVAASLFHDDSGTSTFGTGTALLYAKSIAANDYLEIVTEGPNGGIHLGKSGQLGFTDASSGDLTISIYGMTNHAFGRK